MCAASRTVRVIGPRTETPGKALAGHIGTRPSVGFRPTRPHHAAGMRIEPPASVPICSGPKPAAPAAPAPDDEPPVVYCGFQALRVMPLQRAVAGRLPAVFGGGGLADDHRARGFQADDGRCVVGNRMRDRTVRLPRRVGKPATSTRSFTVHGTPSRGPSGRPTRQRISLSPAASIARGFSTAKAFSAGLSWRCAR